MPSAEPEAQRHWDEVYSGAEIEQTGWYEEEPTLSLALIDGCHLEPDAPILDVGAGASSLVDRLLDRCFRDMTVLDISAHALDSMRARLGPDQSAAIRFIRADVTDPELPEQLGTVELWHDRATLHFLIEDDQCNRYAAALHAAVVPGGYALLATYALHGAST
jgi:cyclopropane fatty-acyl-phospholipid synthase-like methyltransferase